MTFRPGVSSTGIKRVGAAALVSAAILVSGATGARAQAPMSPYRDAPGDGPTFDIGGVKLTKAMVFRIIPVTLPLTTIRITSLYGLRSDPFRGFSKFHQGVDFGDATGTPVYATAAGRVVWAGPADGYGNLVKVQHPFGFETRYAHLSHIDVTVGQFVDRNAQLGAVGMTGHATGPHLHYEIRRNDIPMDPVAFVLRAYNVYHHLN